MGLIDLSNIKEQSIEIKKEHPFSVSFDLSPEVAGGLDMAARYLCRVKHWQTNVENLILFDVTIDGDVIKVQSETVTGLRIGEYFFSIQPTSPTIDNYITIEGEFIVQ